MSAEAPATTPRRVVRLQVNSTGAWRNVVDFDCEDELEILEATTKLFGFAVDPDKYTLRIVIPGDHAPLMAWSVKTGWTECQARP